MADTAQVVCARLGPATLPAALVRLVAEKAEGNPLFAEEIASYLVERRAVLRTASGIEYDAESVAAILPTSIQSLLAARVDQLSPEDRSLLQAASVIGRRFTRHILIAVTQFGDIDVSLSTIQALDLIYSDSASEEFLFKHALVRDALYNSLLQQRKAALHETIATEIERRSQNRLMEVAEALAPTMGKAIAPTSSSPTWSWQAKKASVSTHLVTPSCISKRPSRSSRPGQIAPGAHVLRPHDDL